MTITKITQSTYAEVAKIYAEGIATKMASFESSIPDWEEWDRTHLEFGRIQISAGGRSLG